MGFAEEAFRALSPSSIINKSKSLANALAIVSLCRCPPEIFCPLSISFDSYLLSNFSMKPSALAFLQKDFTSSSDS